MNDYAQVPVHGRNLGYATSQMQQAGIPYQVAGRDGSVYIILIPISMAPAITGAPWLYQPPPATDALHRFPWLRAMLLVGCLIAVIFGCQSIGTIIGVGWLAIDPLYRAASETALATPTPAPASLLERWLGDEPAAAPAPANPIERTIDNATAEIGDAFAGVLATYVGIPLLGIILIAAAFLILRLYLRGRRQTP